MDIHLAVQLGVSRKTTLDVFERLLAEGYLTARTGAGTFVAQGLQRLPVQHAAHVRTVEPVRARTKAKSKARAQPLWERMPEGLSLPAPTSALAHEFIGGMTDKSLFPFDVWRRYINQAVRAQSRTAWLM
jgi:GntR family transcriptional regulator/MocR family aminotransferase